MWPALCLIKHYLEHFNLVGLKCHLSLTVKLVKNAVRRNSQDENDFFITNMIGQILPSVVCVIEFSWYCLCLENKIRRQLSE